MARAQERPLARTAAPKRAAALSHAACLLQVIVNRPADPMVFIRDLMDAKIAEVSARACGEMWLVPTPPLVQRKESEAFDAASTTDLLHDCYARAA